MDNEPDILHISGHLSVEERAVITNSQEIACRCDKKCKRMKGLKMHHRSCRKFSHLVFEIPSSNFLQRTTL